ncbi:MAG: SBBP repeat-containing protein [Candidatus Sumerlaeia bacterium]|nr:SBBP repeat-containing protein [Candidatus Sumerlaeia bacterium]
MMGSRHFSSLVVLILAVWGVEKNGQGAQQRSEDSGGRIYDFKIAYATYLGGLQWDQAREIIVYPDGSVLVGAQACSDNLPVTEGVVQPKYAGDDPDLGHGGIYGGDCYLFRLSADGKKILAATYFGGSKQERNVYGMALDRRGHIVIASATRSPDIRTTPNCFQPKYGGPPSDWMVAKLTGDLKTLLWCTYVGGSGDDFPRGGLTLDDQDNVYVVGESHSPNFPTTQGVIQPKRNGPQDAALVKLKPDGTGLVFATLLGGSATEGSMGVRVDRQGNIYWTGHTQSADFPVTAGAPQAKLGGKSDAFLAKLTPNADRLVYATYLGGEDNEFAEHQVWLDQDGSVFLTGAANSKSFPCTANALQRALKGPSDGFLAWLSADGRIFLLSTLLGGSGTDFWLMPMRDARSNICIVGQTGANDLPVTPNAVQRQFGGGQSDGALVILSPDGSKILYATYLGGKGEDMIRSMALGPTGEIYLVGSTASDDFPVTPGAVQGRHRGKGDMFVVKLQPAP